MKIACLQFSPQVGLIEENIEKANGILRDTTFPEDLQWLILPELALTGYNFTSGEAIEPFLEPTASGRSTKWAQSVARRLGCFVSVGYPEITTQEPVKRYNSLVTVSPSEEVVGNYRKTFLYYTDELWAEEGDAKFFHGTIQGIGQVSMGICMDINPYKFLAPWTAYEFAHSALASSTPMVVLSMAWITRIEPDEIAASPLQTDAETLTYWLERFRPFIESQRSEPVILVLANRCGQEGDVCYAGTSTVLRIERGAVSIYDVLGKAEERCLVVNLEQPPKYAIQIGSSNTAD